MFHRAAADIQIRERFAALIDRLMIPTLYGVRALGTRLCVYTCDKETAALQPQLIDQDPVKVNDRAPANR